jgi:hypothetical protein
MFKWIKNFFTPASSSFTAPKPTVNDQITDSVTQKTTPTAKKRRAKPTTKSPANKKAK